ncbi:MAG: hypothetical protein FWC97_01350 [Treponema sp.]|nr:hypothetical protein [Treponema sp.]
MKNLVFKLIIFSILFAAIAVGTFAETLYGASVNFARIYERHPGEDFGRDLNGASFYVLLNHFPNDSHFGWFVRTSIGGFHGGTEWQDNDINSINNIASSTELRISAGPSYALRAGQYITIPISLGPTFVSYREEIFTGSGSFLSRDTVFLESLGAGLLLDAAIVINPARRIAIINGITVNWDFLRWEKGNLERVNSGRFVRNSFSAVRLGYYFGVGVRFGGQSGNIVN